MSRVPRPGHDDSRVVMFLYFRYFLSTLFYLFICVHFGACQLLADFVFTLFPTHPGELTDVNPIWFLWIYSAERSFRVSRLDYTQGCIDPIVWYLHLPVLQWLMCSVMNYDIN